MFTCTEPVFLCTGSFPTRSCGTHSSPRTVNTALGLPEGLSINHEYVSPTSKLLANKVLPCHGSVARSLLALSICRWLTLLMENIWRQGQSHRENTLLITSPQSHKITLSVVRKKHILIQEKIKTTFCVLHHRYTNSKSTGRWKDLSRGEERKTKQTFILSEARYPVEIVLLRIPPGQLSCCGWHPIRYLAAHRHLVSCA